MTGHTIITDIDVLADDFFIRIVVNLASAPMKERFLCKCPPSFQSWTDYDDILSEAGKQITEDEFDMCISSILGIVEGFGGKTTSEIFKSIVERPQTPTDLFSVMLMPLDDYHHDDDT